jgi:hypothetical protein
MPQLRKAGINGKKSVPDACASLLMRAEMDSRPPFYFARNSGPINHDAANQCRRSSFFYKVFSHSEYTAHSERGSIWWNAIEMPARGLHPG